MNSSVFALFESRFWFSVALVTMLTLTVLGGYVLMHAQQDTAPLPMLLMIALVCLPLMILMRLRAVGRSIFWAVFGVPVMVGGGFLALLGLACVSGVCEGGKSMTDILGEALFLTGASVSLLSIVLCFLPSKEMRT